MQYDISLRRDIEEKRRYLLELSLKRIAYMCDISPRCRRYIARTKRDIQRLLFALLFHSTVYDLSIIPFQSNIESYRTLLPCNIVCVA